MHLSRNWQVLHCPCSQSPIFLWDCRYRLLCLTDRKSIQDPSKHGCSWQNSPSRSFENMSSKTSFEKEKPSTSKLNSFWADLLLDMRCCYVAEQLTTSTSWEGLLEEQNLPKHLFLWVNKKWPPFARAFTPILQYNKHTEDQNQTHSRTFSWKRCHFGLNCDVMNLTFCHSSC